MSADTKSSSWGAFGAGSVNANVGLGFRGTVYCFKNFDNGDMYLFLLADLGFGYSVGPNINRWVRQLWKEVVGYKDVLDNDSFTKIKANKPFSASDLNFAQGGEATAGVTYGPYSFSATTVSAWPFFWEGDLLPNGSVVNRDYFTGQVLYGKTDIGLSVGVAYQFLGRWVKLWSL